MNKEICLVLGIISCFTIIGCLWGLYLIDYALDGHMGLIE